MKRLTAALILALGAALTLPAQAHGGGHGGWRGGYAGGYHGGYHGGHHNHWIGPVLGAALIGGAIYATRTPSYAAPAVVTVPAAPPMPQVAYFCSTWGQYYPSVQTCPVPWQLVSY